MYLILINTYEPKKKIIIKNFTLDFFFSNEHYYKNHKVYKI